MSHNEQEVEQLIAKASDELRHSLLQYLTNDLQRLITMFFNENREYYAKNPDRRFVTSHLEEGSYSLALTMEWKVAAADLSPDIETQFGQARYLAYLRGPNGTLTTFIQEGQREVFINGPATIDAVDMCAWRGLIAACTRKA